MTDPTATAARLREMARYYQTGLSKIERLDLTAAADALEKMAATRAAALEEAAKICDDGAMIGDHPTDPSDWSRACREQARYIRRLAALAHQPQEKP